MPRACEAQSSRAGRGARPARGRPSLSPAASTRLRQLALLVEFRDVSSVHSWAMLVPLETLLRGYREAHQRWMEGPRLGQDAQGAFIGIFEALNWAFVVDDVLRKQRGKGWADSHADAAIVAGFRYARNFVQHDWSEALDVQEGAAFPAVLPMPFFEWCWKHELPSTRWGATEYRERLAGNPVRFTLEQLDALFAAHVQ